MTKRIDMNQLPKFMDNKNVMNQLNSDDVMRNGFNSEAIVTPNNKVIVFRVENKDNPHPKTFREAKNEVLKSLRNDKINVIADEISKGNIPLNVKPTLQTIDYKNLNNEFKQIWSDLWNMRLNEVKKFSVANNTYVIKLDGVKAKSDKLSQNQIQDLVLNLYQQSILGDQFK